VGEAVDVVIQLKGVENAATPKRLKSKYQATDWNTLLDELLYPILLKLEERSQLNEKEIDWLRKNYFAKLLRSLWRWDGR
jgi:hypothetical protein